MQFPKQINKRVNSLGSRYGAANTIVVLIFLAIGLLITVWLVLASDQKSSVSNSIESQEIARETKHFPVTIRKPDGPPRVFTGTNDSHGQPVTVACSTCHASREPNIENKTPADLNEFHGNLAVSHGSISCLSCHNSTDYDALKLADGSRVEFQDVMTLCAQCHGPQTRDYEHGAHGGFNGYWDLTRGPRQKNNCIDCHNPHSPQFPKMQPTFKPRDRFLDNDEDKSHE